MNEKQSLSQHFNLGSFVSHQQISQVITFHNSVSKVYLEVQLKSFHFDLFRKYKAFGLSRVGSFKDN